MFYTIVDKFAIGFGDWEKLLTDVVSLVVFALSRPLSAVLIVDQIVLSRFK